MKITSKQQAEFALRQAEKAKAKGNMKKLKQLQPMVRAAQQYLETGKLAEVEMAPSRVTQGAKRAEELGKKMTTAVFVPGAASAGRAAKRHLSEAVSEGIEQAEMMSPSSLADQLATLGSLHESGALSDEDFQDAKRKLLSS